MTQDIGKRCPADRTRVNIADRKELTFWTQHFGISTQELREAVGAVGIAVTTVGHFLRRRRTTAAQRVQNRN